MYAGVNIVAAVEKDRNACKTYHENLIASGRTQTRLFDQDILQLHPEQVMQEMGLHRGDCDVLLGGPPCQGFSTHRLRDSGVDDPRNSLILRYFEFVKALRPRFFLVENVPGMLWERHREYVDTFYRLAADNEYALPSPIVLNARDYGVPQNRKRVFLIGTDLRSGISCVWPPQATHFSPDDVAASLAPADRTWRTASVVFDEPAPLYDPNNIHMRHNAELTAAFERTPANGGSRFASGRTLPCHQGHTGHSARWPRPFRRVGTTV
jgi:DNA (cytosine-5)-methyltransferase 1